MQETITFTLVFKSRSVCVLCKAASLATDMSKSRTQINQVQFGSPFRKQKGDGGNMARTHNIVWRVYVDVFPPLTAPCPHVCAVLFCSSAVSHFPMRCLPASVAQGVLRRVKRRNCYLGIGTSNHISISGVIGGHGGPSHDLPGPVPAAAVRCRVGGPPVPGVGPRRAGSSGGPCEGGGGGGLVLLRPPAGLHDGVDDWRRTQGVDGRQYDH